MWNKKQIEENNFLLIDAIASEYGWSLNEIIHIPNDVLFKLFKIIKRRKKEELNYKTRLMAIATNCGFSGEMKILDEMFNEKQQTNENLTIDMRNLWIEIGKDPKEYDKQLKENGTVRF